MLLTRDAEKLIELLCGAGYKAYAVGGCVRDSMLNRPVSDIDICTSAKPNEVESVLEENGIRFIETGLKHGTVNAVVEHTPYEITTFRTDGEYLDNRRPERVTFVSDVKDDLARRDFTINAMAYNPYDGLIDLYGGAQDLSFGVIRCVGEPRLRFEEDALRILRALRFAAVLGFTIEPETSDAILDQRKLLSGIAYERIREELLKLLCGENAGFILRRYRKVIAVFIPELKGTFDFEQHSEHHNRDLYRHTIAAVNNVEPEPLLRVTMLFHDIGKPLAQTTDKRGVCHYRGHQQIGAAMTREILRRLCMPSVFIDEVCDLIRWHDERFKPETVMIKGYLKRLGADAMQKLMLIQRADILAQSPFKREEKLSNLSAVSEELNRIITSGECYSLRQLAVNGSDLLHIGIGSGVQIGQTLDTLLDKVIGGELPNEKEALLSYAKNMIDNID